MNKIKNFFKNEGPDKKTLTFQNGDTYEGGWKDGKKNGKGTMKFENGVIYDGDWKDDKIHGKGTLTFQNGENYTGDWKGDKMDSTGTWTYENGDKYTGEWKNDKKNGTGTFTFKNGDTYEGEWKDGQKNGEGTMKFKNHLIYAIYTGVWEDGQTHGKGTMKFTNGDKYDGDWKDSKMEGKGTWTYQSGDKYEGGWKNDKKNGTGTYEFKNGYIYKGEWKDGYVVASGKKKAMAILITTNKTDHVAAYFTIPLELSKKDFSTKSLPKVDSAMIANIKNAVKQSQELNILIDVHGDEKGNIEQEKIKAVKKSQELNILIDVHGDTKGNIQEQEQIKNLITEIAKTFKDENSKNLPKLTIYLGACYGSQFVETQNDFFKEIARTNPLNIKIHHGSETLLSAFYNGKNFITSPDGQGQVVTKTTKFLPSGAVEIGQNTYRSVDDALSRNKSNKIRNEAITGEKPNNKIKPSIFIQVKDANERNLG